MQFIDLYQLLEDRNYNEYENNLKIFGQNLSNFENLFLEITINVKKGEFGEVTRLIEHNLNGSFTDFEKICCLIKNVSFTSLIGELTQSEKLFNQIDPVIHTLEPTTIFEKMIVSDYYNYRAIYHLILYQLPESSKYYQLAEEIDETLDFTSKLAKTLSNHSLTQLSMGDMVYALVLMDRARELHIQNNDTHSLAQVYGNLAETMMLRGVFHHAYDYTLKAHEYFVKLGSEEEIATNLSNQAKIAKAFSNYTTVEELFQASLKLRRQLTTPILINYSDSLIDYIEYRLIHGKEVSHLIEELKQLRINSKDEMIATKIELAETLTLFFENNLESKLIALYKFNEIEDHALNSDLRTKELIINYTIDGLLLHYRATLNKERLIEIAEYGEKYLAWAKEQNSIIGEIKSKLLKAQLAIYSKNLSQAIEILQSVIDISYNKGMPIIFNYSTQVLKRIRNLSGTIHSDLLELDIITSFVNLLTHIPDQIEQKTKIFSIFLTTPALNTSYIFRSHSDEIHLDALSSLIELNNSLFVHHLDDKSLVLLKNKNFWIGVECNGRIEVVVNKLDVVLDTLILEYDFNSMSHEEISELIENVKFKDRVFNGLGIESDEIDVNAIVPIIPSEELEKFNAFLHPVRLSIISVLQKYFQLSRNELLDLIGGGLSTISRNLKKLEEVGIIRLDVNLVGGKPQQIAYITQLGLNLYGSFKNLLSE